MNSCFKSLSALVVVGLLAGCSGGGGSASSPSSSIPAVTNPSNPVTPVTPSNQAVETLSFHIPGKLSKAAPASAIKHASSISGLSTIKPLYISPDTASFALYIDGQKAISGNATTPGTGSQNNISGLAPNSSAAYVVTQVPTSDSANYSGLLPAGYYLQVAIKVHLIPGPHKFGVVFLATDGFVLSEAQQTYSLNQGNNNAATMSLQGVVDSAFWCPYANEVACPGDQGTMNADGSFSLAVFATDHAGDAIYYQQPDITKSPVLLDNGPINLVASNPGIVTLTPDGPFTDPGTLTVPGSYDEAGIVLIENGWLTTMKCVAVGTTVLSVQVGSNVNPLEGFAYTGNNYTTTNELVGPVPNSNPQEGNFLQVNCDSGLALTIN
jgi:hypothetical protein